MNAPENPAKTIHWGWGTRTPVIRQTEAAECGLAALAMVLHANGLKMDLPQLRRRFGTSLAGSTLAQVKGVAEALGFQCRALTLDMEHLPQLKLPCILHWDMNHFVVLVRVTGRHAVIHDPARGRRRIPLSEVSKSFTGVAMEIRPGADFKPSDERQRTPLQAITGTIRGWQVALLHITVFAVALELFSILVPLYLQWVVDSVIVSADKGLLTLLGLGFLAIAVLRALLGAARTWAITWLSAQVSVQWVSNVFSHMLRLPQEWFSKRHMGDIVSRFNSLDFIQKTLTSQFVGALLDGVMSAAMVVLMALYSKALVAIVLGVFLLYGIIRWVFFKPMERASEEYLIAFARQQSDMMESVRGSAALKLNGKVGARSSRYANAVVETTNQDVRVQRMTIAFTAINQALFGIGRVAVIWMGASLVLSGSLTAGMLVAFAAYGDQFTQRAVSLIDNIIQFRLLKMHGARLADITQADPETSASPRQSPVGLGADLELRNVSFRYAASEPWILKDCSFTVRAGESVALIGASGCGKSTLAKLILGLLTPTEGTILLGGVDMESLGTDQYRKQVAAVMQDDHLFSGSIAENISFFDEVAQADQIQEAAQVASIHDEIMAMPMGYETLVGDMGSVLSGGQKQRLVIARSLYRAPRVMVMDEATSSLDLEREARVNHAISRLAITRIIIAHRRETFTSADRILYIGGRHDQHRVMDITTMMKGQPPA